MLTVLSAGTPCRWHTPRVDAKFLEHWCAMDKEGGGKVFSDNFSPSYQIAVSFSGSIMQEMQDYIDGFQKIEIATCRFIFGVYPRACSNLWWSRFKDGCE